MKIILSQGSYRLIGLQFIIKLGEYYQLAHDADKPYIEHIVSIPFIPGATFDQTGSAPGPIIYCANLKTPGATTCLPLNYKPCAQHSMYVISYMYSTSPL